MGPGRMRVRGTIIRSAVLGALASALLPGSAGATATPDGPLVNVIVDLDAVPLARLGPVRAARLDARSATSQARLHALDDRISAFETAVRRLAPRARCLHRYRAVLGGVALRVPADALEEPVRVFMSGGTTGRARPTIYTQWDREAGAILGARGLYLHGIRPGDTVLNAWAYSTSEP